MKSMLPSAFTTVMYAGMVILVLLSASTANAFQLYQAEIPNGEKVTVNGIVWPGVGHTIKAGGSPSLNAFGEAFIANKRMWTVALCEADSDGDGQSNGLELGDPDCTWTKEGGDATLDRTTDISHPGLAYSMTMAVLSTGANPTTAVSNQDNSGLLGSQGATAPPVRIVNDGSGFGPGVGMGGGGGGIPLGRAARAAHSARRRGRRGARASSFAGAPRKDLLAQGSQNDLLAQAPSQNDLLAQAPSQNDLIAQAPSQNDLIAQAPSQNDLIAQAPSQNDLIAQAPSQNGLIAHGASPGSNSGPYHRPRPPTPHGIHRPNPATLPPTARGNSSANATRTGRMMHFALRMSFNSDIDTVKQNSSKLVALVAKAINVTTSQVTIDSIVSGSTIVKFIIELEEGQTNYTSSAAILAAVSRSTTNGDFVSYTVTTITVEETTTGQTTISVTTAAPGGRFSTENIVTSEADTNMTLTMILLLGGGVLVVLLAAAGLVKYYRMVRKHRYTAAVQKEAGAEEFDRSVNTTSAEIESPMLYDDLV